MGFMPQQPQAGQPQAPGAPGMQPPRPVPPIAPQPPVPPGGNPAAVPGAIPGTPSVFHDVSQDLDHHWQMVDGAVRIMKRALTTGGFYQQPEARAGLVEIIRQGEELVNRFSAAGKTMGPNVSKSSPTSGGDDTQVIEPAADTDEGEGGV